MISFQFKSNYRGQSDYMVYGHGASPYRISERHHAAPYEESFYNGPREEYERDIVGAVGLLHAGISCDLIAVDVVDAFNAWRAAQHAAFIAKLEAEPERYGCIGAGDPLRVAPKPVQGAFWAKGWHKVPAPLIPGYGALVADYAPPFVRDYATA